MRINSHFLGRIFREGIIHRFLQCIDGRSIAIFGDVGQAFTDIGAHTSRSIVDSDNLGAGGIGQFLHGLTDAILLISFWIAHWIAGHDAVHIC